MPLSLPPSPALSHVNHLLMQSTRRWTKSWQSFPDDKPILINFYDAKTENEIKDDILRAKTLLKDRCTLVSIKQQDYPDIAKLWDANTKSPAMILFKDGQPIMRLFEETHYLEIVSRVGSYCNGD
ncbi:hypothetical protein MHU86_22189 [Fragilaria crotonensis]|nr:hypothetical protein MHU86_22189 [Fragilaria crotonensis]